MQITKSLPGTLWVDLGRLRLSTKFPPPTPPPNLEYDNNITDLQGDCKDSKKIAYAKHFEHLPAENKYYVKKS